MFLYFIHATSDVICYWKLIVLNIKVIKNKSNIKDIKVIDHVLY